tara:strand:- start:1 stop:258 length:258 start_codon:yes stop_codon:yes gene_type:complete
MIIPVRCFTCNRVLGSKYKKYLQLKEEYNSDDELDDDGIVSTNPNLDVVNKFKDTHTLIFKELGINDRYCCKRHMVAHIDLIKKI